MTVPRYVAPGWPNAVPGHAAFTPFFTRHAGSGAVQYKDGVTGQPGTQAIAVHPDASATLPKGALGNLAGQAAMGTARSSDAPDSFWPNLYYARPQRAFWPGAGMPVSVASDNLMPVPAVDPRGIPSTQVVAVRQRGQAQIGWPATLPRWADVNAS